MGNTAKSIGTKNLAGFFAQSLPPGEEGDSFKDFLFLLPLAIAYVDRNGTYIFSNQAHQTFWGLDGQAIVGKHVSEILGEREYSSSKSHLDRALHGKRSNFTAEVDLPRVGQKFVRVNYYPCGALDGRHGCFVVCEDLTAFKRVEQQLLRTLERLQALYEKTPAMLHSIDREGRLVSVSDFWLETLGYTRDEVLGKRSIDFLTPASALHAQKEVLPEFYKTGLCRDITYEFVKKSGEVVDVLLSATAERNESGEFVRSLAVLVDVSSLRRAEQEKLDLESQIRHIQKMDALGTLAGGIAHDFNNILSGIIGYTELALAKYAGSSGLQGYLSHIQSSSIRAKNLVQQILTFSQRATAERVPVHALDVIEEVTSLIGATIPPSINLYKHISDPSLHVLGDATQLHQVLLNIINNACQAMEDSGGVVDIYLESVEVGSRFARGHGEIQPGQYVRIVVSDTGCGMSEDVRKRIFEPYFTTKRKGEGTGLGLSVCHGIVASHGGTISVWSKPGKGSKFAVYLPLAANVTTIEEKTSAARVRAAGKGRVLFVDDEPMLAQLGKDMLSMLGYEVKSYSNCMEAFDAFSHESDKYDLVITDLTMPGMNGVRLMSEVRRIRPDIPLILSTGFGANSEREKLSQFENFTMLSKPFSLAELGESVRSVLASKAG